MTSPQNTCVVTRWAGLVERAALCLAVEWSSLVARTIIHNTYVVFSEWQVLQ